MSIQILQNKFKSYIIENRTVRWIGHSAILALWLFLSSAMMTYIQIYSDAKIYNSVHRNNTPLPDIGIEHSLNWSEYRYRADYPVTIFVVFTVLYGTIFLYGKLFVVMVRVLLQLSLIYLFRCITLFVTQLRGPASNAQCEVTLITGLDALKAAFAFAPSRQCNDLIFSGHTSTTVLFLGLYWIYTPTLFVSRPAVKWTVRTIATLVTMYIMVTLVWTRLHYTIDVVIGCFVSIMIQITCYALLKEAYSREKVESCVEHGKFEESIEKYEDIGFAIPNIGGAFPFLYKIILWLDGYHLEKDQKCEFLGLNREKVFAVFNRSDRF